MRFLVDENLSPRLAELLRERGHDAVHVRHVGASGDPDESILKLAQRTTRVVISADTDFGALLTHSRATKPSVILVRSIVDRRPADLAEILASNLETIREHLQAGAIVAFGKQSIRVRHLPIR